MLPECWKLGCPAIRNLSILKKSYKYLFSSSTIRTFCNDAGLLVKVREKWRVPQLGSEADKGITIGVGVLKVWITILSDCFKESKTSKAYVDVALLSKDANNSFLFPKYLEIIGLDLANLSLISTSRMSDRKPTKVNCWEIHLGSVLKSQKKFFQ